MYIPKQVGEVLTAIIVMSAITAAILVATPIIKSKMASYKKEHAHRTVLVSNRSSEPVKVKSPIMQWESGRIGSGQEVRPDYEAESRGKNKLISFQGWTQDNRRFSCVGELDTHVRVVIGESGKTLYCQLDRMVAPSA